MLVTKTHKLTDDDVNGAVLSDADLSVLGSHPGRYRAYADAVREEYADDSRRDVQTRSGTGAFGATGRIDLPHRTRPGAVGGARPGATSPTRSPNCTG